MLTYSAINYAYFAFKTCENRNMVDSKKKVALQEENVNQIVENKKMPKKKLSEKENLLPDLILSSSVSKNYGSVENKDNKDENKEDDVKIDFRDQSNVEEAYKYSSLSNRWLSLLGVIKNINILAFLFYIWIGTGIVSYSEF